MGLRVTRSAFHAIQREAERAASYECCGLLLGQAGFVQEARLAANVSPEPKVRFEIDAQALVDAHRVARVGGPRVIGYFHSHPRGPAEPSATDQALANRDDSVWAIAGLDGITFWRDGEQGFAPLSYVLEDG